ncbi:MAG TPA: GAF domain-containing protein [Rhodanobacteraceae bacterium]|jgi:GAF domain-containing protein|nr:GAF domain-containing protein [Rhodanobacteraceae bacterium]
MPARFNAYVPDAAALVRLLDDDTLYRVGRSADCELRVDHWSISRFHAELSGEGASWSLRDTGSKNGLRVDGHLALRADLSKSSWFSIGDVYCWFELIDEATAERHRAEGVARRATSRALSQQLVPGLGIRALIPQTLDVVLELAGLDRGFVLYAEEGNALRVRASRGFAVDDIANTKFAGSAAAVDKALADGTSVVCCDALDSPWLGARPSVRLGGIRGLVCVPLRLSGKSIGAIYADSRKPGPPVTELDLELIENVARHAAASFEAARLEGDVADILRSAADAGIRTPLWSDLRPPAPPSQD